MGSPIYIMDKLKKVCWLMDNFGFEHILLEDIEHIDYLQQGYEDWQNSSKLPLRRLESTSVTAAADMIIGEVIE